VAARADVTVAHTKISKSIAEKQNNKPGVAGEAMSYTVPRVKGVAKKVVKRVAQWEYGGASAHPGLE